jgi:LysR family nitrogen assimilation transcriptional regulator
VDLKRVEYFVCVAKLRSFSKAAQMLKLTQPAISRHIQALEQELHVRLLYRTTRGVMPTEAGEILLNQGEALLEYAQRIRNALEGMSQTPGGTVAIGMPPTIAPALAPLTIDACKKAYPNISLHVIEGFSIFLEQSLRLGKIDLAVLSRNSEFVDLQVTPLAEDEMVLVGAANSMPGMKEISLASVGNLPLIVSRGFRPILDQRTRPHNIALNYAMELDSITLTKGMIMRGGQFSILPYVVVDDEACAGLVDVLRIVDPVVTREIVLGVNPRRPTTVALELVRKVVHAQIKNLVLTPDMATKPMIRAAE